MIDWASKENRYHGDFLSRAGIQEFGILTAQLWVLPSLPADFRMLNIELNVSCTFKGLRHNLSYQLPVDVSR